MLIMQKGHRSSERKKFFKEDAERDYFDEMRKRNRNLKAIIAVLLVGVLVVILFLPSLFYTAIVLAIIILAIYYISDSMKYKNDKVRHQQENKISYVNERQATQSYREPEHYHNYYEKKHGFWFYFFIFLAVVIVIVAIIAVVVTLVGQSQPGSATRQAICDSEKTNCENQCDAKLISYFCKKDCATKWEGCVGQ